VPPIPVSSVESVDREMLTFLHEESATNRTALREETEAKRTLLKDTLRIAAFPLAVIIAVAGFFGWRSISDLRQSVQDEAKQALSPAARVTQNPAFRISIITTLPFGIPGIVKR
jgi:hypothetical protein